MKTGGERFSFPWERDAMRGDAMPEGLPLYDQAAYQAMRYLYALYRRGEIPREDAAAEKGRIRGEYETRKKQFQAVREGQTERAQFWKTIEAAANRFGRERTLENAEAFLEAVYQVGLRNRRNP